MDFIEINEILLLIIPFAILLARSFSLANFLPHNMCQGVHLLPLILADYNLGDILTVSFKNDLYNAAVLFRMCNTFQVIFR